MINFMWKFMVIAVVCVLAASFVSPYAAAQQTSSFTTNSNFLFVSDQAFCTTNPCTNTNQYVKLINLQTATTALTSNFVTNTGTPGKTDTLNGPKGIIFTGGGPGSKQVMPVMLVANQVPNKNLPGDIAKFDPSNGNFLGFLVPQSDPNAPHSPRGIVLSPDHNVLYVADLCEDLQHCNGSVPAPGLIRAYNANTGAFIASYSAQALLAANGDNFNPRGIVFGPGGQLYISVFDTTNPLAGYILTFNPSTTAFKILVSSNKINNYACDGSPPLPPCGMHRPEGIVFDSTGNLWVTSFCATDPANGLCSSTSSTNVDKIMEFDSSGHFHGVYVPLEPSTEVKRTPAQVALFGPNLGSGNLYAPILFTGELRVCDTSALTCSAPQHTIAQSGSPLVQPWYLSFRGTDPSTLAFSAASSGSSLIPNNSVPVPSQPNSLPFQP